MPIVEERRMDRGALLTPRWHADGHILLAQGYAARPGILEYKNADGTITRELVRPETLARSVVGLARCPLTLEHPDVDVRADNVRDLGVGDVDGEVEVQDDGYIRVKIAIRREDAQKEVLNGTTKELSPGYTAKIDKTPGEHPEYGRYDAEQVDRTYNHLAIVKDARGGSRVAIRTDAAMATEIIRADRGPSPERGQMPINPRLMEACIRAGIDVRRLDSDDTAVQLLEASYRQLARRRAPARRRDGRRRRDMDPMLAMDEGEEYSDNEMMGYGDEEPAPPATTDNEDPNVYKDENGEMLYGDNGEPLTKDEVIEALRSENEDLLAKVGDSENEETLDELEPLAEEMGVDSEGEDVKTDGRKDALKLALKIVSAHRGDSVDPRTITHDQLAGYIAALQATRGTGRTAPRRRDSGRQLGSQVWDQSRRTDSYEPRYDSYGPSDIAAAQYRNLYSRRRGN